jgi:sugar phosphate isomerase/epimerase
MMRIILSFISTVLLFAPALAAEGTVPGSWHREKLVAWCIVPFDAKQRGPDERARMLRELGLSRSAYDWRAQHVETFEEEILAYRRHGVEMFAFWAGHEEAYRLFEKYELHPQIWKTAPSPKGENDADRVAAAVATMEPLAKRTQGLGCPLGLYNHGGWGGQPENLVAVCEALREKGYEHVGIVYNFHHAHDRIEDWEQAFSQVKPYLHCLNLNGMVVNGDQQGKKILPLGQGAEERDMMKMVLESGYEGPIGILDHCNETDTAETLRENLNGWDTLIEKNFSPRPVVPVEGRWSFSLPDGNPAWLEVKEDSARLLWSVGSAKPVIDFSQEEGKISFRRKIKWKPGGDVAEERLIDSPFEGRLTWDGTMELQFSQYRTGHPNGVESVVLYGKPLPAYPERPDLSKVTFGKPISLLRENSLEAWHLSNPAKKNGWRVEDGVLINETPKTDFGAYGEFGNLVTDQSFGDFRLSLEYNVPEGGNSGIYLRGIYEAQVVDLESRMQGIQGPGAIFGRLEPSRNAANPGGQWNQYVLTLVDQHITVELNRETVIDNVLLEGCTGGGIESDDTRSGPIFLQGDHTAVKYRNILIEPVVE